jgi:hypothetical protein
MSRWLRDPAGVRMALGSRGLLLGRSSACNVIVDDPAVSRRHALVLTGGPETHVLPLAKAGVLVRGEVVHDLTVVSDGDEIVVGTARFVVEHDGEPGPTVWQLRLPSGRVNVHDAGFSVGGSSRDDLCIAGWPTRACALYPIDGALLLEAAEPQPVTVTGAEADGGYYRLRVGSTFSRGGITVAIDRSGEALSTADLRGFPTDVALELLPNGAILRVRLGDDFTVFLPRLRADLVATLLRPPFGKPGDWIDDTALIARVWGREAASRSQLNVLIHRTRQLLTIAGLDGPALLERAPGGGSTRLRLASGARVSLC